MPQDLPLVHCMASMNLSGLVISYIPIAEAGFAPQKETVIASPGRAAAGEALILTPAEDFTSTALLFAMLVLPPSSKSRKS